MRALSKEYFLSFKLVGEFRVKNIYIEQKHEIQNTVFLSLCYRQSLCK